MSSTITGSSSELPAPISRLLYWIRERESIRLARAAGAPPPWTTDPILAEWSFCNVRREDDRATVWIRENWREPHAGAPDLWHAMAVARLVNLPDTLAELGYPEPWSPQHFVVVMRDRRARKMTVWGPAYVIPAGAKGVSKEIHIADVLESMWRRRDDLRPRPDTTLTEFHARLMETASIGGFLAAQIVADTKYVPPLRGAIDWTTFAASGPGSRRGLNRIVGRPVAAPWTESDWFAALCRLRRRIVLELQALGLGELHAQDLQNCLCEFDKFERVRLGEGTPRRRYRERTNG